MSFYLFTAPWQLFALGLVNIGLDVSRFTLTCLVKLTRALSYILLSCIIQNVSDNVQTQRMRFIWSPVAMTTRRDSESEEGSRQTFKDYRVREPDFLVVDQWWLFNKRDHDPTLLHFFILCCHCLG